MKPLQNLILLLTNPDILNVLLPLHLSLHFFHHSLPAHIHVVAPQLITLLDLALAVVVLVLEPFYCAVFVLCDELGMVLGHFIYKYYKSRAEVVVNL